jgi:hypothetical protein
MIDWMPAKTVLLAKDIGMGVSYASPDGYGYDTHLRVCLDKPGALLVSYFGSRYAGLPRRPFVFAHAWSEVAEIELAEEQS